MKKILSLLLGIVMSLTIMLVVVPPVEVSAATTYEFLFPVNNGGVKIAYIYGYSSAYFNNTTFHYGIDIHSSGDQVIYAAFSGTVTKVNNACPHVDYGKECSHSNQWGNSIYIKSQDGKIYGIYGHLKQNSMLVQEGQKVEKGTPLALMGSSGWSTGKHLHFEVRTSQSNGQMGTSSSSINVNPTNASQNKGLVNYSTSGYNGIESAIITEGTYYLANGDHYVYMIKDEQGSGTITATTATVSEKCLFNITKDSSYYKISPTSTNQNYVLNCYWGKGGTQTESGNEITLWANDGDLSQRWLFEEYGAGYLIHPADRTDLAITREDSKLYVRETTKAENQIWTLEPYCEHSYTYKSNSSSHWKECTLCGDKQTTASHTYTNDCDKSCNTCGHTRTTTHAYTNSCDTSCNVCGDTRTTTHTYNHDCDTDCNVCGATRTTTHSYGSYSHDNDHHWRTCTICNSSVSSQSHYYTNNCDTFCNACGYERTPPHTYDNDCDTDCNICGETRSTQHIYDDEDDTTCNICGETRTVETLPSSTPDETEPNTEPSTEPDTKPNTNNTPSNSDKNGNNDDDDNNNMTIIVIAVASAVTVSAVSILGTALVMKKKR